MTLCVIVFFTHVGVTVSLKALLIDLHFGWCRLESTGTGDMTENTFFPPNKYTTRWLILTAECCKS